MTSLKKIEINQSSLLGLKAELERKKKEVISGKSGILNTGFDFRPKMKRMKKKEESDEIPEKVQDVDQEADSLKKSRKILESKTKTYELLSGNGILGETIIDSSEFLVDFKKKQEEEEESKRVMDDYPVNESDEEWIDYVDCLGRTRRCHKEDYGTVKEQDLNLKTKLFSTDQKKDVISDSIQVPIGNDIKGEIRQKWEEQERILLDKKDVHYQDVLFNEARSHGVGYYQFSTDERDRCRQQEELKRTREETLKRQASARDASEKKKKQTEERLRAARKRKRERLGLPPEEEEEARKNQNETETETNCVKDLKISREIESPSHRNKYPVAAPTSIRPWDVGKEGVSSVLSQKEWIKKKRSERIAEFAPPSKPSLSRKIKNLKTQVTKNEVTVDVPEKGARIPPPPLLYSAPVEKIPPNLEKSIEEGLKFLREQTERGRPL